MQSLLIEVDGRALRFDAPRLLRIGRSIEADVVLAAGSVSRQHAELRPVENGWVLVDSGSQYGTYVDGRRVTEHRISGQITVQCGPPAAG
ncbi:MAG TPA: FHA domain-containing protein, partial [Nocardioides sp.]|nr:FHA domain-containing protein [Nocardioides sp.]